MKVILLSFWKLGAASLPFFCRFFSFILNWFSQSSLSLIFVDFFIWSRLYIVLYFCMRFSNYLGFSSGGWSPNAMSSSLSSIGWTFCLMFLIRSSFVSKYSLFSIYSFFLLLFGNGLIFLTIFPKKLGPLFFLLSLDWTRFAQIYRFFYYSSTSSSA